MHEANSMYWVLGVFCVLVFIMSESFILRYTLKELGAPTKFFDCLLYSFVGFFFSCITPSASGGQPAQVFFMRRRNIPVHVSTVILLMITISYKMVLLVYGFIVLIFRPAVIMTYIDGILFWVRLGMILNVLIVGFMLLLSFKPKITESMVMSIFNFIANIAKNEKVDLFRVRISLAMKNYVEKSEYMVTHKVAMFKILSITFFQRTIWFFITYLVCVSFGAKEVGVLNATTLQGIISVSVDMLPLPGGMGISEHLFLEIFEPLVSVQLATPVMIVSRGISYYSQLIMSALFTGVAYIKFYKIQEWKERRLNKGL